MDFWKQSQKNEAVETINTCITKHTAIANDVIIWELANVIKGCSLNESSRIVLAFMDAPRNLKACILAKPQFIAAYSTNILQTSLSLLLDDNQTEKMGSYLLAEEGLFNGIKLSVHLLQNKGRVVVEKSFTSECSWEKNWVEKIITQLFSILASKVLQKETLSMAAIAMAHIVNHLRLEASLNLAGLILQNAGKSGDSDMGIGPITIPAWCLQRGFSELGFVAVLSSLTTVCRPEILLERAMYDGTPMADEILRHLFTCLCKTIAGAVDSEFRYYSFQALNSWLDAVSRITIEGYHSGAEREPMFVSSSYVCKHLLHLIWENREDMTDGVPKIVLSMFGKVITLNQCERALLGTTREDDQMVHSLLVRLLAEPWYIKGRYALLSEIFRHVCPDQVLQADPCYSASLCKAFSAPILVSAANECYKAFLHSNRNSTDAELKSWNEDYWASVFQSHFLDMLTSQNTRATDNCALYFIPTTLQKIPSTFRVLKDAVLQAMGEARLTELRSSMERNRIRKNLCRAYCSIFKIGRKNGLASYQDIDFQILEECASHVSDELRAEALSVVCCNNKTTEPVSTGERLLVLEFLGNNLNCASSAFRQIVFVSIKIIMARLRDSCIMLLREYQKSRKKLERRDIFEKPPEDLISSIELVEDVFNLSIGCLFPGASFQRKKTGLQLLFAILETFSSPKDAVKRGRTAESLKTLTDWVRTTGKWNFIIERNIEILVSCFEDQHDEIRESALGLLKWFPFGSAGMTEKKASKFGTRLLSQTRSLLLSPRIRDAESGAILLEFIASRYLQWNADSVFEVKNIPDESFDEMKDPSEFSGLMHIMFSLLRAINKHIDEAYQDVLLASVQQPVFGFVMAARRCLRIILQHLSSRVREPHNAEKESKMLGSFVSESVKVCRRVTFMALFVFKKEAGEKDVSPSFADMSDSINEALRNCKSFPTLEEQIGYQHCIELLSSFCWLNTKASTLLLGELGRIMTIDNLDVAFRKKILSDQNFNEIVEVFRETLLQCRHKGVIENSNVGFQTLCKSVASISSMTNVLNSWVVDTINAVDQNDLNSSVTKRSAGLPMFLGPLMSACVSSRRFDFAAYIEKVLDIAKRPLTTSHEEQTDLPQVQAMNILKTMYRDSWLGSQALKYAQEGLMLCVDGFSSPSWAVRNAAQILLGSLVPRMFGQRVTQVDESHHNSLSAMKFFEMYPKLKEFFMEKLQCEGAADQQLKNLPALIPILTMLSRMRPCSDEMLRSDFCPLLERLISCPVFAVRQLAAFSLVLFLPGSELEAFVHLLLDHTTSLNENLKHGIMLMIKRLIQIKDDEKTVGDCVSSGTLLALSRSMLQNEFAKTLAICTLFEIFVNVFPKICSSSDEDDVLLRDYIQSSLGMLLTTVTDVTKTADEPGVYLYLKRLAQLVVAFSFHWQNIDAGFAAKVLSTTLASGNYHLLTETASELTNYFKRGDYFKSPLKTETLSKIYNQISLSEATGFQSVMMDCYSYAQKGLESFRSPVENTLTYFNSYLNMNMSETSHKYLASLMPFMGSLMKQFYSHSAANLDVINEVSKIWSEKLVTLCLPEERESLRWSCVEAVGWTTGTFLRLFKQYGEAAVSPWTGTLALVCARLIFAALTLSQDEDENIRNSVTDIALAMSETSEESVPQQLHPNLAIKVIFKYIQENMKNNVPLFEVLLGSLSDLVREKASPAEQTRSTFLFEQESSNLFAEKVVYAKQVIGCLEEFAKYIMEDREKQLEWLQKMTNNLNDFSEQIIEKHQLWTGTKGELSQDNMSLALFGDTGNSSIYLFLTVAFALLEIAKCVNANEMVFKMTELVQKNLKLENLHPLLENGFKKCLDEKEQAE